MTNVQENDLQSLIKRETEINNKYMNKRDYEISAFIPDVNRIRKFNTTPIGCTLTNPLYSEDTKSPTMTLVGKQMTPNQCKMEAAIHFSNNNPVQPIKSSGNVLYSLVKVPGNKNQKNANVYDCYVSTNTTGFDAPLPKPPTIYKFNLIEQPPLWSTTAPPSSDNLVILSNKYDNGIGNLIIKSNNSNYIIAKLNNIGLSNKSLISSYRSKYFNEIVADTTSKYPIKNHYINIGKPKGYTPFSYIRLKLYERNNNIQLDLRRCLEDGRIYDKYTIFSIISPTDAVANSNWKYEYENNNCKEYIDASGETIIRNSLITKNCKFKLKINEFGNLSLVYCKNPCTYGNNVVGFSEENARYLHSLEVPTTFNHIYYNEKPIHKLTTIKNTDNILTYNASNPFTKYNDYAPKDISSDTTSKSAYKCKQECLTDPACDYYYNYKVDNREYCQKGANTNNATIIPSQLLNPIQVHNGKIQSSTLNIKNKVLDISNIHLDSSDNIYLAPSNNNMYNNNIPTMYHTNYTLFSNSTISNEPIPKYLGRLNDPEVRQFMKDRNAFMLGKKASSNVDHIESFTCTNSSDGCLYDISGEIARLKDVRSKYVQDVLTSQSNHAQIQSGVKNMNELYATLSTEPKDKYELNTLPLEKTPTIVDAANDDINEMILQQNNMYILGTIASASLIITAILLSGSD